MKICKGMLCVRLCAVDDSFSSCSPSKCCRSCELEFASVNRDLTLALDMILNHKMSIESKVRATEERVMACLEDVESMPAILPQH